MSEVDKELAQYLAELAVTNPQQLPLAMMKMVEQRLMLAAATHIQEAAKISWGQLEEVLRRVFNSGSDDGKFNRP